jgi:hypothetical protein
MEVCFHELCLLERKFLFRYICDLGVRFDSRLSLVVEDLHVITGSEVSRGFPCGQGEGWE